MSKEQKAAPKAVATLKKTNIGDAVITRVNALCASGFSMPADFNYVNAVKMTILKLQDTKDKNGQSALQVCSQNSVATALFQMCTKGLNAALNQCYLIVRGDQLTLNESYFGKILQVKRIYPNWSPAPRVIREGDEFEMEINPATGHRKLIKHTQTLASMDAEFIGGYVILPTEDGEGDLYVMTKKQILAAWAKSSSREHLTHKQFDEKMVAKTVVNSGCNTIINATPALAGAEAVAEDPNIDVDEQMQEEVVSIPESETEVEVVNTDTGEVTPPEAPSESEQEAPAAPAPAAEGDDW